MYSTLNYYNHFKIVPSEGRFAVMMESNVVRRWDTKEQAESYLAEIIAEFKRQPSYADRSI